ncbi:hypothetical protein NDU88_002141 [Pleurodeles waltl]|uniref:Uncharacterized protein n=1 Tax=Pleurodeles waltl TaxID=8319 RepID=A0AAV7W1J1_PLEWA|nr:hypothetical protein NDU88_002141 [Pleurodeles waltl]
MVCVLPNTCTWLGPSSPMLHLCCTCVLQCGFCVTPMRLPPGRPSSPEGSREIDIGQRSSMRPPTHHGAARQKMERVADPAGPGPEAETSSKSETARGEEGRVDTGGPNQQSAAKQHSPSVVAQMVSLSHAASLMQERGSLLTAVPLGPRGRAPVKLLAPAPAAAPGVRRLRQPQGKLRSQRTRDHDPSMGAGSLLPHGPPPSPSGSQVV